MPDEQARHARVMRQIDRCDELMEQCNDAETFVKLTGAKERLWNLCIPKAGVMRPRPTVRRPRPTLPDPEVI